MRKKTSAKETTETGKARRKLTNLAPKRVRAGEAGAVKGGPYNPPWSK